MIQLFGFWVTIVAAFYRIIRCCDYFTIFVVLCIKCFYVVLVVLYFL